MGDFRMPSLGADMESGTIIEWRVRPGDTVRRGDIVALVDTDKADIEVEVFESGVVDELVVDPGVEVPVGTVLAHITATEPAAVAPAPAVAPPAAVSPVPIAAAPQAGEAVEAAAPKRGKAASHRVRRRRSPSAPAETFVRASPLARRLAGETGADLASLRGSGPGGAVLAADVDNRVVPAAPPVPVAPHAAVEPPPPPKDRSADRMRVAIGDLMARSKREIPHYYLATTIDLHAALGWLAEANEARPVDQRLLPAVLLLKATALAARKVPAMNGIWDRSFRPSTAVHLGVAVSLRGGGLVAPAIRDADRLEVDAFMEALRDVVQRARAGRLRSSDMTQPTLTVTNLGDVGVDDVFGVIYPPQVALVGFGKIAERPWAAEGMLGVRPVVRATLAADHRVSDGHDGARFLAIIDRLLQDPEEL